MPASGPGDPWSGRVLFAAFPAASAIEPASPSAPAPAWRRPSGALSFRCTVYLNRISTSPSVFGTYDALRGGAVARASNGVPVTVTASLKVTIMLIDWSMPYVPAGVVELTASTRGGAVSSMMVGPAKLPGAGRVRFAALPPASRIEPPPVLNASVPAWRRPPGALSFRCTVYLNRISTSPSVSSTYVALLGGSVARASVGLPMTVTGSPKETAMSIDRPMPYVPAGVVELTASTRGGTVSSMMPGLAKSPGASRSGSAALPAASTTEPPVSAPVPLCRRPSGALSPGCTS